MTAEFTISEVDCTYFRLKFRQISKSVFEEFEEVFILHYY